MPASGEVSGALQSLRVLHLEDDPADAELVAAVMRDAGYACEVTRVDTSEAFERAAATGRFDVILSDHTLPSYDGATALAFAKRWCPQTPFILVSGTVGEDVAVGSLLDGATDYVVKNRLFRLVPALQRALREADNWRARQRAEEARRASEERYRRLFETSKDGILLLEAATGQVLDANQSFVDLLGLQRAQLLNRTLGELRYFGADAEGQAAFREIESRDLRRRTDVRLRGADGREVDVELVGSAYEVERQRIIELNMRDVTERRRLEEELRQSQKLEAVGRLAGGVAHDFNNLLLVINSYTELAMETLPAENPLKADLDEVRKAGLRAANLTGQLLAFSRKQILRPVVCSLNALVSDFEKMLRRVIGEDIELQLVLADALGNVRVDPGQVDQVLANLVVNSRDAMERGGRIVIETENVELTAAYAQRCTGVTPGAYVCLCVSDTGSGMDEATMARMFEPFFTTKAKGKGTGLGLSTVYGIVKQSGGHIDVESALGRGTSIRVYFPRVQAPLEAAPEHARSEGPQTRASETILLVEDDGSVRRLVRRVLEELGYRVLAANSGAEAIALVARYPEPIHLLLTDVVLPGIDGAELARTLLAARPAMKVLYMSGYTAEAVLRHGPTDPRAIVVQKPFALAELTHLVGEVLARRADRPAGR